MRKFTNEQIMLYLYGEASPILKLAIDKALETDEGLLKEVKKMTKSISKMEKEKPKPMQPAEKTVKAILEYAKKTANK